MRKVIYAVSLAFALGGASAAFAGCGGKHASTKNDLETPVPVAGVKAPEKKG